MHGKFLLDFDRNALGAGPTVELLPTSLNVEDGPPQTTSECRVGNRCGTGREKG